MALERPCIVTRLAGGQAVSKPWAGTTAQLRWEGASGSFSPDLKHSDLELLAHGCALLRFESPQEWRPRSLSGQQSYI